MIFSYSEDPEPLWRDYRQVSRALKASVEIYISTIFLPKHLRVTVEYWNEDKWSNTFCHSCTFKKYSPDRRRIYFDMAPINWKTRRGLHSPTDYMHLDVIRYPRNSEQEPWYGCADAKGESHNVSFHVKLLDGVTAGPADSDEGMLGVEVNLEEMTMSFDWQDMMTKTFMDCSRSGKNFLDYRSWRRGQATQFPWWYY